MIERIGAAQEWVGMLILRALKLAIPIGLAAILVLSIVQLVTHPASHAPSCEELWSQNQATAGSMAHDRYIANCEQTDRDLRDGSLTN